MRVPIQEEVLEIRSRVVTVKHRRETTLPHAVRKLLTFLPEKVLEPSPSYPLFPLFLTLSSSIFNIRFENEILYK